MASVPGKDVIYEAANLFRERCLVHGASFLWPSEAAWTPANIKSLWDAFMGNPDTGDEDFLTKWKEQLAKESDAVHRIAADVMAFYCLFTSQMGREKKREAIETVCRWRLGLPDLSFLEPALATSLGSAGPVYLLGRPSQIAF